MANNDEDKVHLVQTLLTVNEVFVYRIPPMKTSGGHRAEDWDLSNPLKTCKLTVERMDNSCLIKLIVETLKRGGVGVLSSLFAQSIVTITSDRTLQFFLEPVVDSSRYFVLKIEDAISNRTAHIGIGFRERDDASNFTLALQDYERSIQREFKAVAMHTQFEQQQKQQHLQQTAASASAGTAAATSASSDETPSDLAQQVSKLTLKEGEKIRINLLGRGSSNSSQGKDVTSKESKKSSTTSGVIPLLKKPPRQDQPVATTRDETADRTNNGIVVADDNDDEDEWSEFQQP